ncbi:MAG TPA: FkbM family methyltransferase, partial [Actinomycetota bacterium]|nr:FkbM family methyltransferase [Actinomycetota bacterium]
YEPDGVASTLIHRNEPCLPDHMRLEPQPRIMADCFDLEQWILDRVPLDDPCVVKMDIEGAEYPLLNHLILQDNAIWRIQYLLVEWHGNERRRWRLEDRLREVGMTVEGWAH